MDDHPSSRAAWLALLLAAAILVAAGCRSAPAPGKTDVVAGASGAGRNAPAIVDDIAPLEDGPRTLVVYFSQGSATRRVAEDLAAVLRADVEPILEKKQRTWGFLGFMAAGAASSFGRATPILPPVRDPSQYDALVVCTPIWAWHMAPPVRSWLRAYKGKLPALSAFVTVSGDTDPARVVAAMAKESGRQPTAFAGFADRDFEAASRSDYLARIAGIVEGLRRQHAQ